MILFPPDTFPFWLNNERELVKLIHVGIQCKKAIEHLAEQLHISLPRKAVAVERDLHIQAAQQEAILKTLDAVVPHVQNGIQTTVVEFIIKPVVERQRTAQHLLLIILRKRVPKWLITRQWKRSSDGG